MRRISIFILSAAVLLSASCKTSEEPQASALPITEETVTASETAETEITTAAEVTALSEAALPVYDYSNFSLKDYCGEFDNAQPISYHGAASGFNVHTLNEEKMKTAREALKNSEYYIRAITRAKELFVYENGAFSCTEEAPYFEETYLSYLEYTEDGFSLRLPLEYTAEMRFDGENEENLFIFSMPAPDDEIEWSGRAPQFFVPVFVNSNNEAHILYDAAAQTLCFPELIYYSDKEVHIIFGRGHSMGTIQSHIYSIENGTPKLEYIGGLLTFEPIFGGYFLNEDLSGGSGMANYLIFRDSVSGGYCAAGKIPLPEEAAELLLASEDIKEQFPDLEKLYEAGELYVIGGKYIASGWNTAFSFENGVIELYEEGVIIPPYDEEFGLNIANVCIE